MMPYASQDLRNVDSSILGHCQYAPHLRGVLDTTKQAGAPIC